MKLEVQLESWNCNLETKLEIACSFVIFNKSTQNLCIFLKLPINILFVFLMRWSNRKLKQSVDFFLLKNPFGQLSKHHFTIGLFLKIWTSLKLEFLILRVLSFPNKFTAFPLLLSHHSVSSYIFQKVFQKVCS